MTIDKPILDATCGGRMMWFNKQHPSVLYVDNRFVEGMTCCDNRRFSVHPDMIADFRNLPFPNGAFKLVVFDPPHLVRVSEKAYMCAKYGRLPKEWQPLIHDGFHECLRVLDVYGTLIFKWSEVQIPTQDVIRAIGIEPLFGHISGKKSNTNWMAFMKFPKEATP